MGNMARPYGDADKSCPSYAPQDVSPRSEGVPMRFLSSFFSSPPSPSSSFRLVSPLLLLMAIASSSCENKHIGRPCEFAFGDAGPPPSSGTSATIDTALECPSRICLLPGAERGTATTSLCTADCSSDDDCADGELKNKGDSADHRCSLGFVCRVAETVGDFCCRRMCICKDFLNPLPAGTSYTTPEVCKATPANKTRCQNIK
jgi:hypothetical protein